MLDKTEAYKFNPNITFIKIHPSDKLTTCRDCAGFSLPGGVHPSDKLTTCRDCEFCSFPFIFNHLA